MSNELHHTWVVFGTSLSPTFECMQSLCVWSVAIRDSDDMIRFLAGRYDAPDKAVHGSRLTFMGVPRSALASATSWSARLDSSPSAKTTTQIPLLSSGTSSIQRKSPSRNARCKHCWVLPGPRIDGSLCRCSRDFARTCSPMKSCQTLISC